MRFSEVTKKIFAPVYWAYVSRGQYQVFWVFDGSAVAMDLSLYH